MADKISLTINKKALLPTVFAVLGAGYYLTNILFPYDETLEIQSSYRIIPQSVCGVWALICIVIATMNFRRLIRCRDTILFVFFEIMVLFYCFFPSGHLFQNFIYVLKTHFSVFYYLALSCLLKNSRQNMMKTIFVIFAFQLFYAIAGLVTDKVAFLLGLSRLEQFDSNSGFILASCIPLALLLPKKHLRIYTYILLAAASIYSGQRSAALAVVLSFPFCLLYLAKYIRKRDVLIISIIVLVLMPLFVSSVNNLFERNMADADKGTVGSGRSVFWKIVWDSFWDGNLFNILLGNGTNSVVPVIENGYGLAIGAHNGWLDMLYSFGIIGVVVYGTVIFRLVVLESNFGGHYGNLRYLYLITFIILFVKCTTSHGYFGLNELPIFTSLAILWDMVNVQRNII